MLALCALTAGLAGMTELAEEGPPFPRIANCYAVGLSPSSTADDIAEIARFDLLIGGVRCNWGDARQREKLAENVEAVRRLNPHVIILDFSSSAPYARPNDTTFPQDGWLLQPDGRHIAGWPGTEMINLTKPEVVEWLAARSVASVRDKGFDGTFIDCMGGGFDWWACNIATGEPYQVDADQDGTPDDRAWLNQAWVQAKTELSRRVREALGPEVPFMTNQAGEWGFPYMNGILLEDYLDYVLAGRMSWDRVMRDYLHWTQAAHRPNVTTIVSSSGLEPPFNPWRSMTPEDREALLERGRKLEDRMRFGLATTLMGDGYYAYDLHTRWRGQRWWYPEYDAPLGYPKAPADKQADGTWRREFDGGTVIVNPTLFDATVRFAGRHADASSGKVNTEFVVPAMDGRILLPTEAPVAEGTIPDPDPLFTLSGPERTVKRDGHILCRLQGAAAIFDGRGQLLRLTDGTHTLVEGLRPFIVSDDRWRDFGYEDVADEVSPDGRLVFTGRRTEDGAALVYREEVSVAGRSLTITYDWEALTDVHVHMWRQQLDFPVTAYGGGRFSADEADGELPAKRSQQPQLAGAIRRIRLAPAAGPPLTVEVSGEASLVDERHYGVEAYRLGHYPAQGDLKAGGKWRVTIRLRLN
ncbi:MAG: putative glycoside hydrolase [Armatimonadota bacterium]